jgi:uncharacterized protein (DUF433 family)
MTDGAIYLKDLKVAGTASALHKPGAVRLDGYPLLVHAPRQWGDGVRTENNGTPVADVCAAVAEEPDLERLADRFGITTDHVEQALRYGLEAGYLAIPGHEG